MPVVERPLLLRLLRVVPPGGNRPAHLLSDGRCQESSVLSEIGRPASFLLPGQSASRRGMPLPLPKAGIAAVPTAARRVQPQSAATIARTATLDRRARFSAGRTDHSAGATRPAAARFLCLGAISLLRLAGLERPRRERSVSCRTLFDPGARGPLRRTQPSVPPPNDSWRDTKALGDRNDRRMGRQQPDGWTLGTAQQSATRRDFGGRRRGAPRPISAAAADVAAEEFVEDDTGNCCGIAPDRRRGVRTKDRLDFGRRWRRITRMLLLGTAKCTCAP